MTGHLDAFGAMEQRGEKEKQDAEHNQAKKELGILLQQEQYTGETLRMDFRTVTVQIHDHTRRLVGGVPHLSYLVASRMKPWNESLEWTAEDCSVLLLRVLGAAPLPSDAMDTIIRSESARRAIGVDNPHWDTKEFMDGYTRNQLSMSGLACEVVGTFYLGRKNEKEGGKLELRFGTDINNFYPNKGLKVYKPIGDALRTIVNFRDPSLATDHPLNDFTVRIGHVRYASTNRLMQGVDDVEVKIAPVDLLAQRSALFGMSRTGKSNTTKIIARAIYNLRRAKHDAVKVGQLIFDYNGEYANENTQGGGNVVANALKNVWREQGGIENDVLTYGLNKPQTDPARRLLQINAYGNKVTDWINTEQVVQALDMLVVGKSILADLLVDDNAKYIRNFGEVDLSVPNNLSDHSKQCRYRRAILIYRTLLKRAGLDVPSELSRPDVRGPGRNGALFGTSLLNAMRTSPDANQQATYTAAANALDVANMATLTWDRLDNALEALDKFIAGKDTSGYTAFNTDYIQNSSTGEAWADTRVLSLLEMFRYANGRKSVERLRDYHEPNNQEDFAKQIYKELCAGKLVIVDQAGGEPSFNEAAARRIMWAVFRGNQQIFIKGETPSDLLVYVEEAHNLLPPSKSEDTKDVWVRTAKEGSKYRIGLVYATQEVSSIQKNILKNTANWFIAHLNNTDETKELRKFYDFANFEDSILRAQNRGFLRVKMLSNPFINPVQILPFQLDIPQEKEDGDGQINELL
jgi:hypothetical protein